MAVTVGFEPICGGISSAYRTSFGLIFRGSRDFVDVPEGTGFASILPAAILMPSPAHAQS